MTADAGADICRLCGGRTRAAFARPADDGTTVGYHLCLGCGSLQTDVPDWLAGVYAESNAPGHVNTDTWAASRSVASRTRCWFLWRSAGFGPGDRLLDWGGGAGLLVRLLRDAGVDAWRFDLYAPNYYATGFDGPPDQRYAMVTAFEVLEHFAQPSADLARVFALQPSLLVVTTGLYRGQGPDWDYLGPAKSEHVFFYSEQALRWIADRFGYAVRLLRHDIVVFHRPPAGGWRLRLAALVLYKDYVADLAFALLRKRSRADDDHRRLRERPTS